MLLSSRTSLLGWKTLLKTEKILRKDGRVGLQFSEIHSGVRRPRMQLERPSRSASDKRLAEGTRAAYRCVQGRGSASYPWYA